MRGVFEMGLDDIFERYKNLQVSDGHDAATRPFAAEAMTTGMRWLGRQYNSRPFDIGVPGKIQVLLMGSWK